MAHRSKLTPEERLALPYKVICISIYNEDLQELDEKVADLKHKGFPRANRSWLIRYALRRISPEKMQANRDK